MEEKSLLPKYFSKVLDNGLEVYVIPIANGSGVIETNIFYKVGSRNEVMGKSGIAHMLEHLNFKSTKNLKAGEFDEIVKKFGGVTNASTSFDYTRYFVKSSAQNLEKSLELFAELMQNLKLDDAEFQPERDVVAEERRWRTDNSPIGYLYFRFFNTAYVYHPYHWTPIGFMDDIKNWKIEDIRAFHKVYYQPKNAVIVVSGDIQPQTVFDQAQKHFGSIQNTGEEIPEVYMIEPKQDGPREIEIKKDSQIEYFALGFKIPNFKQKDQVALDVLGELLSGGKSSLLYKTLVDEKQIASEVYSYPMDLRDEGVFLIIAAGNDGVKAEKMQEEIQKILQKLQEGKIKQADLDKVILNLRANFIYRLEDASSVASLFGEYLAKGDLKPLLEYEKNLKSLTIEDLVNVAKKYFVHSQSTSAILRK
ncbi:M16 family metallopeptidase [Helicobacter kayseriensis]|uniref:M16 family metallopeptidase n=1 Tax=Helicobacter kayseriensis TaxID=2905877 RepID=UPI001E5E286D|nr:insulinase family protein [Helicobacter kayseriensis]MCE3048619.1 insulinase family protein [Helicobacter kayseriensis]